MNKLSLHFVLLLFLMLGLMPTKAQAVTTNDLGYLGTVTLAPGERKTIWVPDNVYSIASNGYLPSCNWTQSSNSFDYFKIVSRNTWSCTIEGITPNSNNLSLTFKGNSTIGSNVEMWIFTGYYLIEVKSSYVPVTDVSLNIKTVSMKVGDTKQLSATISPSNATNKMLTWKSSRPNVVSVNSNGLVTANTSGTVMIDCIASDGSKKQDRCIVDVTEKDNWQNAGNYTVSWYKKDKNEFILSTNKELAGMAYLVNNGYTDFEGKTIKLTADIDLSGKQWIPCDIFKGIFDGGNHTIKGINVHENIIINTYDPALLGFWRQLNNVEIRNLKLLGDVNLTCIPHDDALYVYVGGMAGEIWGNKCVVENCICDVNVNLTNFEGTKDYMNTGGVGGFFGKGGEYFGNVRCGVIRYCKNNGKITCIGGNNKPFYLGLGGIIGHNEGDCVIEYCENNSSLFSTIALRKEYFGGIVGMMSAYGTQIRFCRNILQKAEIYDIFHTSYNFNDYHYYTVCVGGIVGDFLADNRNGLSYGITNCYSVIGSIDTNSLANDDDKHLYYGGIASCDDESVLSSPICKSNFSNNNVQFVSDMKRSNVINDNTSFTSEQMKTEAFLNDLNLYSMLELDSPVWILDSNDNYPHVIVNNETSRVDRIKKDVEKDTSIYSLSGQRLQAPRKGINIIGGKKVVIK